MDAPRGPKPLPAQGALLVALCVLAAAPLTLAALRVLVGIGPNGVFEERGRPGPRIADKKRREPPWAASFRGFAKERAARESAEVALYVSDTKRRWALGVDADRPMYLASGVKLLFMVELLRQREAGELSLDEELLYEREDVRDGAPSMNKERVGRRYPIRDLLLYMIRDSDNAAADLLIERIGPERVHAELLDDGIELGPIVPLVDVRHEVYRRLDPRAERLQAWQVRDVRWRDGFHPRLDLLKKHIGPPYGDYDEDDLDRAYEEYYALGRNHASMRAMGRVLEALAARELVSRDASEDMLWLLEHTWTSGRRVEGRLPEGTRVAHKTGTQHERICDLAIIWLPDDTPIVFAIAVQGGEREAMEDVIADLARRAYDEAWSVAQAEL